MNKEEKTRKKKERIVFEITVGVTLLSMVLYYIAKGNNGFADWYVTHIYPLFLNTLGRLSNVLPISVVEFLIYGLIIYLVWLLIQRIKKRKTWSFLFLRVGTIIGCILTLYILNCGINYFRTDFVTTSNLEVREYTKEELAMVCQYYVDQLKDLENQVDRDDENQMYLTAQDRSQAPMVMKQLSEEYEALGGYYPRPKALVVSQILSYQHLSGVYIPFTMEANYNGDMVGFYTPFTMCHELSHLKGFMKEEEANFIAYLACVNSNMVSYRYSGYLMGYIYGIQELRYLDEEAYASIKAQLPDTIKVDLMKNNEFWDKYEGKIAEISNVVNDTYLKVNAQTAGVRSYNQVVGLMVADYIKNN